MPVRRICNDMEAKVSICDACAADLNEREHMRSLCSGLEATLKGKSANAVPVQRILMRK